jgi:uncharacterized protein (DUF4415 family)
MATRKERIVRATAEELGAMKADGLSGSDWKRAAKMLVPDRSDPDDAIEPVRMDWVRTELPLPRRKAHASLRIDADVLDWFRGQGRGYQTRINAILRSYFEQHTR